jgi:hypothetical protein
VGSTIHLSYPMFLSCPTQVCHHSLQEVAEKEAMLSRSQEQVDMLNDKSEFSRTTTTARN